MPNIKHKQLLANLARIKSSQDQKVSHKEIQRKIDEIKFLSTQKKIPRISLRREIVNLERHLDGVFSIEKKLLEAKKKESNQIKSLKNQISTLKHRMNASLDKDLQSKVNKLTFILGELLAKTDLQKDVALSKKLLSKLDSIKTNQTELNSGSPTNYNQASSNRRIISTKKDLRNDLTDREQRAKILIQKIKAIRQELEIKAQLNQENPKILEKISLDIQDLEKKLEMLKLKYPALSAEIDTEIEIETKDLEKFSIPKEAKTTAQIKETSQISSAPISSTSSGPVKHKMIFDPTHPTLSQDMSNQNVVNFKQSLPRDNNGELTPFNQNSLDSTLNQNQETGQMNQFEESEDSRLNAELMSELPLPPPPKIKRK